MRTVKQHVTSNCNVNMTKTRAGLSNGQTGQLPRAPHLEVPRAFALFLAQLKIELK